MLMNCASNASAMSRAIVVLPRRVAPQDAAVRPARLERQAQWHARPQHMLLADDFGKLARTQALGQGLVGMAEGFTVATMVAGNYRRTRFLRGSE